MSGPITGKLSRIVSLAAGVAATLVLGAGMPIAAHADNSQLFITSAVENGDLTVTLPLHRGTSHGQPVLYIITDTNDGSRAQQLGVNRPQKLANAANSGAVQSVSLNSDGSVNFPATVNFSAQPRVVVPGPAGFPPQQAQPSAIGEPGYSPLIQLPDGTVENAPQVANASLRLLAFRKFRHHCSDLSRETESDRQRRVRRCGVPIHLRQREYVCRGLLDIQGSPGHDFESAANQAVFWQ
jgi:hypothetical protein